MTEIFNLYLSSEAPTVSSVRWKSSYVASRNILFRVRDLVEFPLRPLGGSHSHPNLSVSWKFTRTSFGMEMTPISETPPLTPFSLLFPQKQWRILIRETRDIAVFPLTLTLTGDFPYCLRRNIKFFTPVDVATFFTRGISIILLSTAI